MKNNISKELKELIKKSGLNRDDFLDLVKESYYEPDEDDKKILDNLRNKYLSKFVRWENYEDGSVVMYIEKIKSDFTFCGRAIESLTENSCTGQGGYVYHEYFEYSVDDPDYHCPEIIDIPEIEKHISELAEGFIDYTLPEFTNIKD